MLRLIMPLLVTLAAIAAAPAFATGKSPGAYTNIVVRAADDCARACADDGLCMAWSFYGGGACELTATVPVASPAGADSFGLAARAPRFAAPALADRPALAQAAAPATAPVAPQPPTIIAAAQTEADLVLLGGPEESDLRPRQATRQ